MVAYVIVDAQMYYNEFNISGLMNKVELQYNADTPEATALAGDGTRRRISGLIDVAVNSSGYVDQSAKDTAIYERIGHTQAADLSIAAQSNVEGSRAFFLRVNQSTYNILGAIGEVAPFSLDAMANRRLVRGIVGAVGVKDSDGVSSVFDLGSVAADGEIAASLHVMGVEGTNPTMDVEIKSSSSVNFTSPTNRLAFTEVTDAATHELMATNGPITDQYWRVDWDLSGVNPEYDMFLALGVWKNPSR